MEKNRKKNFDILTSVGLFVSRILRAFEEEINELRPFFTSAFRAFLSGAEYFLASSISLQLRCKVKILIMFVLDLYLFLTYFGSTTVFQTFGSFSSFIFNVLSRSIPIFPVVTFERNYLDIKFLLKEPTFPLRLLTFLPLTTPFSSSETISGAISNTRS